MKKTLELALLFLLMAAAIRAQVPGNQVNWNQTTPAPPTGTYNAQPQGDSTRPIVNASMVVTYPTRVAACSLGGDLGTAILNVEVSLPADQGGIVDARACTQNSSWASPIPVEPAGVTILLPCVTVNMSGYLYVPAGTNNVRILGCTNSGATGVSGPGGGTVFEYTGTGAPIRVGDSTYLSNTNAVEIGDLSIYNASAGSTAKAIEIWDTQDLSLHDLVINGSSSLSQIGLYLDGSGNYTGGEFRNIKIEGEGQAIWMSGNFYDSETNATANASTFTRLHIVCPTSAGSPISGTYGIDLLGGDGNVFVGGDVEACDTLLYLGASARDNSFFSVRNENTNTQISAASGSQYNLWEQSGTLGTGKVIDAGTHNSFIDTFHRSSNNLNGDLWRSQADTTVTNHVYTGIGLGNVRGRQDEWQTDVPGTPGSYQFMWTWGPGDGTTGGQTWLLNDDLNSVQRLGFDEHTTAGGNNQTRINSSGSGGVFVNTSANSGTGGFTIGSGGGSPTTIAHYDSSGNSYQLGNQSFYASATEAWYFECASTGACNIESMYPNASEKHIALYNGGGTDFESEASAGVSVNNSSSGSTGHFTVYGGGASYYNTKLFQVQNNGNGTANYLFPSLSATSAPACIDVDTSGYFHVLTYDCGSSTGTGTVNSASAYAAPYYPATGNTVSGATPFTGLEYWPGSGAPAAATAAQVVAVIASTPVADATYATTAGGAPPTGSTGGDLSGSYPSPTVAKIEGGTIPINTNHAGYNSSGQPVASPNTLGCIDGYDHLPCVVYQQPNQSISASQGSYTTVWPASGNAPAGIYRVTGYTYGTQAGTCSAGSATAETFVKATQSGGTTNGWAVASAQLASSISSGSVTASPVFNVAASSTAFSVESTLSACSSSGTFSGTAIWSFAITIERLQ
jgi:hypothetical protein